MLKRGIALCCKPDTMVKRLVKQTSGYTTDAFFQVPWKHKYENRLLEFFGIG